MKQGTADTDSHATYAPSRKDTGAEARADIRADIKADIKEMAGIVAALALICAVCFVTGVGCLIKFLTGVSCPGCGISRALLALARGDLGMAFYYHPLFWFPILLAVLWFFRRRFSSRLKRIFLTASIALYLAVYVIRMRNGGDIVVFRPQDGMIARIVAGLSDGILGLWH